MFGSAPSWYALIRAARYLHVPPWELAKQPLWWMNIALTMESAEAHGKQALERRERNRSGNRG